MPKLNRFDLALTDIDNLFHRLSRKAQEVTGPAPGEVQLTKREARARFQREWKSMSPEQREAHLSARGVDSIMDMLGAKDG